MQARSQHKAMGAAREGDEDRKSTAAMARSRAVRLLEGESVGRSRPARPFPVQRLWCWRLEGSALPPGETPKIYSFSLLFKNAERYYPGLGRGVRERVQEFWPVESVQAPVRQFSILLKSEVWADSFLIMLGLGTRSISTAGHGRWVGSIFWDVIRLSSPLFRATTTSSPEGLSRCATSGRFARKRSAQTSSSPWTGEPSTRARSTTEAFIFPLSLALYRSLFFLCTGAGDGEDGERVRVRAGEDGVCLWLYAAFADGVREIAQVRASCSAGGFRAWQRSVG